MAIHVKPIAKHNHNHNNGVLFLLLLISLMKSHYTYQEQELCRNYLRLAEGTEGYLIKLACFKIDDSE